MGLTTYFKFYSHERPHSGLGYRPPLRSPQNPLTAASGSS